MIVCDVNVLAYTLVPTPLTAQAERARAKDKIWVAPSLLRHELLNVLARYVRHGMIDRDEAIRAYRRALKMVEVSITGTDPIAVFRLVERSGCTTYDIEYVLLARELGLPLVTADAELVQAFPDIAVGLDAFVNRS